MTNTGKTLLIIVIIAVIVSGVWYFGAANNEDLNVDQQSVERSNDKEQNSGGTNNGIEADAPETQEFIVEASNFKFSLSEIKVQEGDRVRITLINSEGLHDLVLDEFNAKTGLLKEGEEETIEFIASEKGEFEYYCSVGNHRAMGMIGVLYVE